MLDIPYEKNRGESCALSCYTMTARYFFSESTFEQIAEISDWKQGYAVWGFKFWLWIMDKGIKITEYDLIDLLSWSENGIEGLKNSISKKEYNFIVEHTYNIDSYSDDIKKVLTHPNFTFKKQRPNWEDLVSAFNDGAVCEVVLDSVTLDKKENDFSLHRIVVLDITNKYIIFHDPRTKKSMPKRKEKIELFKKAWLEKLQGPELCIYQK
ncbi:hypothetical protein HOD96_03820 [Candidatus Falkowbacteria bacterium]|jgi:hypothetical protein|nr:hypothetical protein [Candidatus Falkowbacteria bacterium]MBT4432893.1 hypothetical protein [Candidatus Falkowbacteria bacterium]